MGKATGFLDFERKNAKVEDPLSRIRHFHEFRTPLRLVNSRSREAAVWSAAFLSARTVRC